MTGEPVLALVATGIAVVSLLGIRRERRRRALERATVARLSGVRSTEVEREPGTLERRLSGAGLDLDPAAFWVATLILAAVAFLLTLEVITITAGALIVAGLAFYLPHWLLGIVSTWRGRRFEVGLADAIDLLLSGLQAGESLPQALAGAAVHAPAAVRIELQEVVNRLRIAMPIERAFGRMAQRYDSEGMRLFTQTIITKWNAGGELVGVLRSVQRIIRERLKLRMHLQSQLAGHRASAFFVAIFPYLVVPFFLSARPQWVDTLTTHPLGPTLLVGAIALQLLGLLWFRRILAMEL